MSRTITCCPGSPVDNTLAGSVALARSGIRHPGNAGGDESRHPVRNPAGNPPEAGARANGSAVPPPEMSSPARRLIRARQPRAGGGPISKSILSHTLSIWALGAAPVARPFLTVQPSFAPAGIWLRGSGRLHAPVTAKPDIHPCVVARPFHQNKGARHRIRYGTGLGQAAPRVDATASRDAGPSERASRAVAAITFMPTPIARSSMSKFA